MYWENATAWWLCSTVHSELGSDDMGLAGWGVYWVPVQLSMIYWQYTTKIHYFRVKHNILGIILRAMQVGKTDEIFFLLQNYLNFSLLFSPFDLCKRYWHINLIFLALLFIFNFARNTQSIGIWQLSAFVDLLLWAHAFSYLILGLCIVVIRVICVLMIFESVSQNHSKMVGGFLCIHQQL